MTARSQHDSYKFGESYKSNFESMGAKNIRFSGSKIICKLDLNTSVDLSSIRPYPVVKLGSLHLQRPLGPEIRSNPSVLFKEGVIVFVYLKARGGWVAGKILQHN